MKSVINLLQYSTVWLMLLGWVPEQTLLGLTNKTNYDVLSEWNSGMSRDYCLPKSMKYKPEGEVSSKAVTRSSDGSVSCHH